MPVEPALLARGPWERDQVEVRWRDDRYEPQAEATAAADAAIAELRERGSPSHDRLGARLADYRSEPRRLELELQPSPSSLRLGHCAVWPPCWPPAASCGPSANRSASPSRRRTRSRTRSPRRPRRRSA